MLFSTYEFLFVFFPLTFFIYYSLPDKKIFRNSLLLVASLYFYSVWDIRFLPFLLCSILTNYILSGLISRSVTNKKPLFVSGVVINLLALGFYKYTNFFLENVSFLFSDNSLAIQVGLPLGISFITFQQITYLLETYRGNKHKETLVDYALFVSFFPQLIAGPIVHYNQMMPQFVKRNKPYYLMGISFLIVGLFKKVVIADSLADKVNQFFDSYVPSVESLGAYEALQGSLAYTMQLYFDFSGYSDMAVGLGCFFGVILPFNFNSPYKARNISDFWRRWHITLSEFLRDHLYIPLGGSRKGKIFTLRNLFITMFLGGLWHGAGWTFIFWGCLHGFYLVVHNIWRSLFPNFQKIKGYGMVSLVLTFFSAMVAWIFFRATSFEIAWKIMRGLFDFNAPQSKEPIFSLIDNYHIWGLTLCCFVLPNSIDISNWLKESGGVFAKWVERFGIRFPAYLFANLILFCVFVVGFYEWGWDEKAYNLIPITRNAVSMSNKEGDFRNNFFRSAVMKGDRKKVIFIGSSYTKGGGVFEFEKNGAKYRSGTVGMGGNYMNNALRQVCMIRRLKSSNVSHVVLGISPLVIRDYTATYEPFMEEGMECIQEEFNGNLRGEELSDIRKRFYAVSPERLRTKNRVEMFSELDREKYFQLHGFLNNLKRYLFSMKTYKVQYLEMNEEGKGELEMTLAELVSEASQPVKSNNGADERFNWTSRKILRALKKGRTFDKQIKKMKEMLEEKGISFYVYETPTASHKQAPFAFPAGFFESYQSGMKEISQRYNVPYLDYSNLFPYKHEFMFDIFHPHNSKRVLLRKKILYDIFVPKDQRIGTND